MTSGRRTKTAKPGNSKAGGQQARLAAPCVAVVCLLLGACASAPPKYDINDNAHAANGRGRNNNGANQVVRSSTDKDDNWGDAMTAPLDDLNLRRTEIPQVLQDAAAHPYDLGGLDHCEQIAAEVGQLDAVLGKDYDEPPPPKDTSTMTQKGGAMANDAAVGAVRGAARSIIPFRGLVRQMTGADAHEKEVDNAIQAGKVRRAYLKGVGMNKNCAPPAAPSWFKPRVYVQNYTDPQANDSNAPGSNKRTTKHHH